MDSAETTEAICWRKIRQSTRWDSVFGHFDGAMYLLSQIFAAVGLIYIYKLARLFVDENKAVLASMLQLGIIYYDFSSVEFNVNVISLSLWPMSAYYFWLGYKNNKQ